MQINEETDCLPIFFSVYHQIFEKKDHNNS